MDEISLDFSASAVLQRMRESLKNPANQLEGGFCMDNLQAVAEEISRLDTMEVMPIPDRALLDTAEGEFLDRKALEYNESRNQATAAVGTLVFTGEPGTPIPLGTEALYSSLVFETTATARTGTDGTCEVGARCQSTGPAGNAPAGAITALRSSVDGVKGVTNPLPFGGGADTESDSAFRQRIFDKIRRPITSGNRSHFIYWAKQVSGVGGAKCLGAEVCGAGKVKVIVLSDRYQAPDSVILDNVKAHIEEERPIGAGVTVVGAVPRAVRITAEIQVAGGYSIADIRQNAVAVLQTYLDDVNRQEFDRPPSRGDQGREGIVSYYRIGDLVFGIEGVADIVRYTLNGGIASLSCGYEEYFTLEEVDVHAVDR